MAGGFLMSVSSTAVDQAMDKMQALVGQAQSAVAVSEQRVNTDQFRPAELEAIGNYLETPTLAEVYPGLERIAAGE